MNKEQILKTWKTIKDIAEIINAISIICIAGNQVLGREGHFEWLSIAKEIAIRVIN